MVRAKENFTAGEAAKITGVAYRTLDHWARTSLIGPSIAEARGTGSERRYSFEDLVALRVLRELRTAGISPRSFKSIIEFLRQNKASRNPLAESRLVVAGSDVLLVAAGDCTKLYSVLNKPGQGVFAFMVDLHRTIAEVKKNVENLRAA
jgi:DNA-binding transcriptional MerR regulator